MPTSAHELLKDIIMVPEDVPLKDFGLDSLDLVEFTSALEYEYDIDLTHIKLEDRDITLQHTLKDILDEISYQKTGHK